MCVCVLIIRAMRGAIQLGQKRVNCEIRKVCSFSSQETGYNPYVAEPRWMSRPARSESRTTGSNVLDKFCEGRKLMPVVDVDNWGMLYKHLML